LHVPEEAEMSDHDEAADAFVDRLFGAFVQTWDVYAIYLGDKLGYYSALADGGPLNAGALAAATGTLERYAREWLEQQAVAGIIEVDDEAADPAERRFTLPPAHAEVLNDPHSLRYLAPAASQVVASGRALPRLVPTYRGEQTFGWDDYDPEMREGQSDLNRPWFLAELGTSVLPSIPDVHERLMAGGRVADIGCGGGWSTIAMAKAYPDIAAEGYDLDEPSVEMARRAAAAEGVADRVRFHARDAADEDLSGSFDLVTAFECIHDLGDPVGVLRTMRRLRNQGGSALVVDEKVAERFTAPGDDVERYMYGFSITTCLPDGMSHPGSVGTGTVMRPDTLRAYAQQAGFADIEILPMDHDAFRLYRLVG
jgi:2-polyprenyl-3-methyl-5-hydroxy-6-metoxy-1,4-benzoquinol methylase